MYLTKRFFSTFLAFALCAVLTLGSLSFMPKFSAFSPSSEITGSFDPSSVPYSNVLLLTSSSSDFYSAFCWDSDANPEAYSFQSSSSPSLYVYDTSSSSWHLTGIVFKLDSNFNVIDSLSVSLFSNGYRYVSFLPYFSTSTPRTDTVYYSYLKGLNSFYNFRWFSSSSSFDYLYSPPSVSSVPRFFDFQPFFFPQLPYGYFDGHINSIDGSFNIDYPSSIITGSINQNGFDTYSLSLPNTSSSGEFNYNDTTGIGGGWFNTTTGSGTISQTAVSTDSITLNVQDSSITYSPTYNETARFRTWSVVSGSSYCYFVCDTRNTITGSLESVSGDKGKLRFSAVGADGVHYPFFCIEFAFDGTKLQTLQALPNGFTVSFKGGTLEQDQDTGIWSCDPLYHGFWLSDGCPPVVLSSLTDETYKWLANPVFGDEAFTLNFLNAINDNITGLRSDLSSLQSVMQSSISNQTSAFENMDAPSASQPSTSQMMDYFSKESAFSAPNTDEVFSGDIKSGHYWDGVTWWSSKFNDIIVSNQVIVAFTTAMLTLGLAVLIIGRRFSMR